MKRLLFIFGVIAILVLAACSSGSDTAEEDATKETEEEATESTDFPTDHIELVIPFSPGGASDMVSRAVGQQMEDELGVPVTPVNKEGATGTVGMTDVKNSEADGYTIGYVPVELSMVEALEIADIKPSDFTLLGRAMIIPATVTVPADAPYDTIEEFIEYAEENPGKITIGTSGSGSIWHVAGARLAEEEDVEFNYVPFDGASEAVTALLGGHIEAATVSPSEVQTGFESGDLKVLAVMSEERDPLLPDVPTLKESGIDVEMVAWGGFVVPKDTPEDVVKVLEDALKVAIDSDEFVEIAESQGLNPAYLPADEFQEFAEEQYDMFMELIPELDL